MIDYEQCKGASSIEVHIDMGDFWNGMVEIFYHYSPEERDGRHVVYPDSLEIMGAFVFGTDGKQYNISFMQSDRYWKQMIQENYYD